MLLFFLTKKRGWPIVCFTGLLCLFLLTAPFLTEKTQKKLISLNHKLDLKPGPSDIYEAEGTLQAEMQVVIGRTYLNWIKVSSPDSSKVLGWVKKSDLAGQGKPERK